MQASFVSSRDAHGHEMIVDWTGWLTLADKVLSSTENCFGVSGPFLKEFVKLKRFFPGLLRNGSAWR
jgi:hypothetical protein